MVFEIGVWFPASDQAMHLNLSFFKIKTSQINPGSTSLLGGAVSKIRTDGLICYSRAGFISAGANPGSRHDKAGEGLFLEVLVFISWNCCLQY